jgi:hypothetical protein
VSGSLTQYAETAANTYGVPYGLFSALIQGESGWNPNSVSNTGAIGLGQILPSTATNPGYGVSGVSANQLYDPQTNLDFSASYLRGLYNQSGSWLGAVTGYNLGPGNVGTGQLPYAGNSNQAAILNAAQQADSGSGSSSGFGDAGFSGLPGTLGSIGGAADPSTGYSAPTLSFGNSGGAGTNSTGQGEDAYGCSGWISTPMACIQSAGAKVGWILLGLGVIVVGVWMLAGSDMPSVSLKE